MPKTYLLLLAGLLGVVPGSVAFSAPQPLFASEEPLPLVLELPLRDLLRRAKSKPTVPGVLRYVDRDGTSVELQITVTTRGKSRLTQCSLPPLSISLNPQQVGSTVFSGQTKLKLVTQCRSDSRNRRYLLQEYAIYKAYNLLTPYSFRVRKLEVTYLDSGNRRGKDKVQPAFFLESHDLVAKRHSMRTIDANAINVRQLEPTELGLYTLFQYLIGNTDWSVRKGPGEERCCHNGKVIAPPDSDESWVVVPYDFDQAGIINTNYAVPSDLLSIRSVRQRLYRGFCASNAEIDTTVLIFNEKRDEIEALFGTAANASSANKSALKYVQGFYKIINDPKKRRKKIIDACQGTSEN